MVEINRSDLGPREIVVDTEDSLTAALQALQELTASLSGESPFDVVVTTRHVA